MKQKFRPILALALLALCATAFPQKAALSPPPATPKHPVTDVYHGNKVIDPYRWLEDGNNPEVQRWSDAQNQRTHDYLDKMPMRAGIRDSLRRLMSGGSGRYFYLQYKGGRLFCLKMQPPKDHPLLVVMASADDPSSAKVVVDPNQISDRGSVSIDYYAPSHDGKLVAVSLSANGTEDGTAHIFEVETGKELGDQVPRANGPTAGGSIAWNADDSGFYYTRYPQGDERPREDRNFYQQIYFHKLGTESSKDEYVIGKEFPRIAEIQMQTTEDGRFLLATVANGDGGQFAHYLMDATGHWQQVTHFEDGIVSAVLGKDAGIYMLSRKEAPRGKVLRVPLSAPQLNKAEEIVAQSQGGGASSDEGARASIQSIIPAEHRLYVVDVIGGPSRVRGFELETSGEGAVRVKAEGEVGPRGIWSVSDVVRLEGDDILFLTATWLEPPAWYRYAAERGASERTGLLTRSAAHFDDVEVSREFAVSKDGTRVPLNIIRRKGTRLDGSNPVLLEGYGGFSISLRPEFVGSMGRIWLDQGGVYVIANLRGGGEYGEEWHRAGNLTHKQNVFDDFIACAEYLIRGKYTSPQHLAIMGGSNGGLLMGAVLTQRPKLFRAVVSFVGIYDSLRGELSPNGVFNVPEFGTVKDPAQFRALYAYSPYHHVKKGTAYPAVLFATGANDGRVDPYHSRKMTARLQAASSSGRPILLRTSTSTGHGLGGMSSAIEGLADTFTFLFDQLGIEYQAGEKDRRSTMQ
ncbi:MAG TPA: prolyl oligopeptidase family serine peptidase [Terriglobales bacterium]